MPSLIVKIEYDQPLDENWLNPSNVAICLHAYCTGTKFEVTEHYTSIGAVKHLLYALKWKLRYALFPNWWRAYVGANDRESAIDTI